MNKFIVSLTLLGLLAPGGAGAIVGGAADSGPLSRSGIMLVTRTGMCSGIVLAPDVVLTAGHCVAGDRDYRVHYRNGREPVLLVPAARTVHPGYNAKAVENRRPSVDLALVRLADPLPASFETATLASAPPPKGAALTVGGYGVAESDDPRSTGTFRIAAATAIEPYGPSRILLWGEGRRAGACQGDSGGPMAVGHEVAAVTIWSSAANGRGCGGLTQGILVGPQRDWIDRTLAGWGRAAQWR
ncbi:S1 family peptidase [Microvirga pudoricolor]|uniref:S1 family peptidase n=1 Tax=Microvirga pudoricolor TaxID=2778729 RepID=UPI001950660A|nr:trypsin-like serine protease [Microvirga pudoricolor]MBM6592380.1 trypsin-like serine protease [Microvirga pudoricolor]